jgi:hypothetical protein
MNILMKDEKVPYKSGPVNVIVVNETNMMKENKMSVGPVKLPRGGDKADMEYCMIS